MVVFTSSAIVAKFRFYDRDTRLRLPEQISVSSTFFVVPVLFRWLSSELTLNALGRFSFMSLQGTFETSNRCKTLPVLLQTLTQ